jgi:hypothetical protein
MPVMTPAGCRAGIAAVLATVAGIGQIHQRRRIMRDEGAIRDLLYVGAQSRINGWMISPAANNTTVTERHPGHRGIGQSGGGNALTTFQWQIEGYFGLDDANGSEETFQDLAWLIADTFNGFGAIDIVGIVHQLPCDVEAFGYAMIANFQLVHFTRIGIAFQGRTRPQ